MRRKLLRIIQLTVVADSVGAPFEMRTREYLLDNLDTELLNLPRRDSPFDKGCEPGEYTDDGQQTIAVSRHLERIRKTGSIKFNYSQFIQDCLDIYDEDKKLKGVARGGHGKFVNVAEFKGDRIAMQDNFNKLKQTDIGNGSGMRLNPFMLPYLDGKELIEHIIGTTISTHNDLVSVIGNLIVVNILRSLYDDCIDPKNAIDHCLEWLNNKCYNFPDLSTCRIIYETLLNNNNLPQFGNFDEVVNMYKNYLNKINELEPCTNNLDNINHIIITENHAKSCLASGGTGLPARAKSTIGWFLYLIKNLYSCKSTLDIIKRCILVGGDTDTLAAYVFPISCIVFNRNNKTSEILPKYIMNQLKEIDIISLNHKIGI